MPGYWPKRILAGCLGKAKHPNKGRAEAACRALRRLDEREGVTGRPPVGPYYCPRCRSWHIGHSDRNIP